MSAVPFGILGALVTNWARGLENDVYFQIGLLVLIGLGAKNAVLRVSAAVEFRKQGKTYSESPELEDLSMSGVAEFGRQFLLLKRRKQYEMDGKHDIWFSWGGSAGHQGLKVLEAFTGTRTGGVEWQASLLDPHALELEDAERAELQLLRLIPFDKPNELKAIRGDMGLSPQKLNAILKPLIAGDLVEQHGSKSSPTVVLSGTGADRKTLLELKYQTEEA